MDQVRFRTRLLEFLRKIGLRGTDDDLVPRSQIMLLGGNPLPIRVAAHALEPTTLILITTPQVGSATLTALYNQLERVLPDCRIEVRTLEHAFWRDEIFRVLKAATSELLSSGRPIGLHYTGGTKVMAAQSLAWWNENHPAEPRPIYRCTYLDGAEDALVFDGLSGKLSLRELPVSLEDIMALHGLVIKGRKTDVPHPELVHDIHRVAIQEQRWDDYLKTLPSTLPCTVVVPANLVRSDLAGELQLDECRAKHPSNFKRRAYNNWDFTPLSELCPTVPKGSSLRTLLPFQNKPEKAAEYLLTGWFEEWFYERLRRATPPERFELYRNVEVTMGNRLSELDLVGVYGHTPFLFSCTTISRPAAAKHKAMEAFTRTVQLGGEMARYVMAFWGDSNEALLTLWDELASHWDGPDSFRVLGLPHYRGEAGVTHRDGARPVMETLDELVRGWLLADGQP